MKIVREKIQKIELADVAKNQFGNLVKAVVDVEREIVAIGGELHADEEALLIEDGSKQEGLWGVNLYPEKSGDEWIEFDSMVNVRPSQNNLSRGVENPEIRAKIQDIVRKFIV